MLIRHTLPAAVALALPAFLALAGGGCAGSAASRPAEGSAGAVPGTSNSATRAEARIDRARIRSLQAYAVMMTGRADSALALFQGALAEARAERTPAEGGEWGLALAYRLIGRLGQSDTLLQDLGAKTPTQPETFLARGWLEELAGDTLGAIDHYARARRADSTYSPPYLREARLWARRGEMGRAEALLLEATALGDTLADLWRADLIPPAPLSSEDSLLAAAEQSPALTRLQWASLLRSYGPLHREDRFPPPPLLHFHAGRDSLRDLEGTSWVSLARDAVLESHIDLYPDGTFHPDDVVSRGRFALWLDRFSPDTVSVAWLPLVDLSNSDFRWGAVQRALARGLLSLPAPDRFEPDQPVTGPQAAAALRRLREGS